MKDLKPSFTLSHYGNVVRLSLRTGQYRYGGGLALQLLCEDREPYATVSVNVEGVPLAVDEFIFKTYSENEGLLEGMLDAGVVELTGRTAEIGPICRLKLANL